MTNNLATYLTNQVKNQSLIPSTGVTQVTLTLKMTIALLVIETLVTVNNSSIQDYVHPVDHTQPTCFNKIHIKASVGKLKMASDATF